MKNLKPFPFLFFLPHLLLSQAVTLDSTFNMDGKVTTAIGNKDDSALSVVIQPDGKIVVAGFSESSPPTYEDFAVVRYHPDGTLDHSFGTDGTITTDIGVGLGGFDIGHGVVLQPDGKIVVAGESGVYFAAVRYHPDGALDSSFSTDGKVSTVIGTGANIARAVALQSDGKIVIAGDSENGDYNDIALVRYHPDGALDNSFSADGIVTTAIGPKSDGANSVCIQPDGKIVAAGKTLNGSNFEFALVRYHPDGALDNSFSADGIVTTAVGPKDALVYAVTMQSDGKIVAVGYTNHDIALARYHTDGTLDNSFGTGGILTTDFDTGSEDFCFSVCIQPDGKIVVAGASYKGTDSYFTLVRYNPDGTLDNSFGTGGKLAPDMGAGIISLTQAVALQSDGKIIAAGALNDGTNADMLVVRCLSGPSVGVIDAPATFNSPLIYPNPVLSGVLTLAYSLPSSSSVHIELLDLHGNILATLLDAVRVAGESKEILRLPEGLPDGFYLLNIRTERGNSVVRVNTLNRR